jgi:4-hydroxybenzoate polyprenyltransferase
MPLYGKEYVTLGINLFPMKSFFNIIRWKNLAIIAITQYVIRYFVISPILQVNDFQLQLSSFEFLLLVSATITIAAAGYVINDYFDIKTDLVNRPDSVVVGKEISRRTAIVWHIALNIIGVLCGIYLALRVGKITWSLIPFIVTGLLWFYSTSYKRSFLLGNIMVALLTAIVPLTVIVFEIPLLNKAYAEMMRQYGFNFSILAGWVGFFSLFAFLTTLIREIIKDAEDFEGDSEFGRNTLPIVLGINITKAILLFLIFLTSAVLAMIYFKYLRMLPDGKIDFISLLYFAIFILIPLLWVAVKVLFAKVKGDYRFASSLMKFIMLAGLLYAVVADYIVSHI